MKRNIILYAAMALASIGLPACSDILNQKPLDSYTDSAVWEDLALAESFLNNCYLRVEAENAEGVMFCNYTDETYHMHDYGTSTYTQGRVSCDDYNTGWTEGKGNTWAHYYGGIKLCNQLLENIPSTPDLYRNGSDLERSDCRAGVFPARLLLSYVVCSIRTGPADRPYV